VNDRTLHPDIGDVVERVDNGRRLALVECAAPSEIARHLAARPEKEPEPLEAETVQRVGLGLDVARDSLMAVMKRLDLDREQLGAADLHLRVGRIVNEIDDLTSLVAERHGS
jgi:hypothetical protein